MNRRDFSSSLGLLALGAGSTATLAAAAARLATVRVDRSVKYQTIEGFGFFGARDSWWGDSKDLMDPAWARLVIDDLGLSMWRNEYYPPSDKIGGDEADADWLKQRPVMEALRNQAAASRVPLKTILSIWSAPASMKCASNRERIFEGQPNPDGTKNGGAVCPSRRQRFAEWLIDGLQLYKLAGVNVSCVVMKWPGSGDSYMVGFEVATHGRFWVAAEALAN